MPANDRPTLSLADPDRPGMNSTSAPNEPVTPYGPLPVSNGRYELLDEIARGGMGVVYRARDLALGREVAVKVLHDRYGPDSAVARRFHDEARIAAQLQHPGIPPVHDLGTLSDGRPFLAMKLIKGRTLDDLLESRTAPSAERGRLLSAFEQLCQAVAYAHAHGVIHRDLKPANVMVGSFGEVQVMDWGLAKVLTGGERDATDPEATGAETEVRSLRESDGSFTQAGSVLGTPAFMPPEQAVGSVSKVDRRSDVFGLGAILSVILTGKPPFTAAGAETIRVQAAQGDLAECFSRLDASAAEPELVTLCKRCLAPKQSDRPADAGEVAGAVGQLRSAAEERARRAELDRVQAEGELSLAQAKSAERRKRRRLWIGAAAALSLAVIGGLGVVLFVQGRANADLAAKNHDLDAERVKVEQRFDMARKAIASFHKTIEEQKELEGEAFKPLRAKLLKDAGEFYRELESLLAGASDAKSKKALADGYSQLAALTVKIGDKKEAIPIYRRALALRRELAAEPRADVTTRVAVSVNVRRLGGVLDAVGNMSEALRSYEEARDLAAALETESPTPEVLRALAGGHNSIGAVLSLTGKPVEALESYAKARAIQEKLVDANPEVAEFRHDLSRSHSNSAQVLRDTGRLGEALESTEKARGILRKLVEAHPSPDYQIDLARRHLDIGFLLEATGKPVEALAAYEEARATCQKLVAANPAVTGFQRELAASHHNIGRIQRSIGKLGEALESYENARSIQQKLVEANPAVTDFQSLLADSHFCIGNVLRDTGKLGEALASYEKGRSLLRKLVEANPAVTGYQSDLAKTYNEIGQILRETGKLVEALAAYDEARAIRRKLAAANPAVTRFQSDLAWIQICIAFVLSQTGKPVEALAASEEARAIYQKLAEANPAVTQFQNSLAESHFGIGYLLNSTGKPVEALESYEKARSIRQKLVDANPTVTEFQRDLAASHLNMGNILIATGKLGEALGAFEKARAIQEKLVEANPAVTEFQRILAHSHHSIGNLSSRTGKPVEALGSFEKALAIFQKLAESNPAVTDFQHRMASIHCQIGEAQLASGKRSEALESYERARVLQQKLVNANPSVAQYQIELASNSCAVGDLLFVTGDLRRALESYERGRVIFQKLADANPGVAYYRLGLGNSLISIGRLHATAGRYAEAVTAIDRGLEIDAALVESQPTVSHYAESLGEGYAYRGWVRLRTGRPKEAAEDLRQADRRLSTLTAMSAGTRFEHARALALLAKLGTEPKSGVSAEEAKGFADRAVVFLADALASGWAKNPAELKESDFEALHDRADFCRLAAMPELLPPPKER